MTFVGFWIPPRDSRNLVAGVFPRPNRSAFRIFASVFLGIELPLLACSISPLLSFQFVGSERCPCKRKWQNRNGCFLVYSAVFFSSVVSIIQVEIILTWNLHSERLAVNCTEEYYTDNVSRTVRTLEKSRKCFNFSKRHRKWIFLRVDGLEKYKQ